jgi:hypothetical protein
MKLQNNMDFDNNGDTGIPAAGTTGMSVSPTGRSFAGDYTLKFDAWANFPGPFPGGSSGTTQLSTFGIGTSGAFANYPGAADGVWFAATHDGGSGFDYRAYSQERTVSYQVPPDPAALDGLGNPIDSHATYHAGSRNNTAALYTSNYGSATAPPNQLAEYSQQTGTTQAGAFGMEWHEVEITKMGNLIDWKVDGVSLITIDSTHFVSQPAGTNIMFGSADINGGASTDPLRFDLLFTLIDNVRVEADVDGDYNQNGTVDVADYTVWRDGGSPDDTIAGYNLWRTNFGRASGSGAAVPVPEPMAWVLVAIACAAAIARRRG